MVKTAVTLLFVLSCFMSYAQPDVVIFGGPQFTSARYRVNEEIQPSSFKPGFMAGIAMKVPFDNNIYFYPSVFYSLKGYKVTLNDPSFPPTELAINNNTSIHTMEICPLLQIDFNMKPTHLFLRVGPSVDFAFSGKEKFDTLDVNNNPGRVSRPMIFSFADYGRITASGNLHFGYEGGQWMVFGFYQHGIGSMNNADGGPAILHRIGGLAFAWKLGRKRT